MHILQFSDHGACSCVSRAVAHLSVGGAACFSIVPCGASEHMQAVRKQQAARSCAARASPFTPAPHKNTPAGIPWRLLAAQIPSTPSSWRSRWLAHRSPAASRTEACARALLAQKPVLPKSLDWHLTCLQCAPFTQTLEPISNPSLLIRALDGQGIIRAKGASRLQIAGGGIDA